MQVRGELVGGQVVVHLAVDDRRQPGVGDHRDRHAAVLGQVPDVLAHLAGAGGAVEPDHVDAERFDDVVRGADLGSRQHRARQLDGDLCLDRHLSPDGGHRPPARRNRCLEAEQVELRLDEEQVDATVEQTTRLDLVHVAQLGEADVTERRHLRAGTHGAGHEPWRVGAGIG